MKKLFIVPIILSFALVVGGIVIAGISPFLFFDVVSAVIVIVPTLLILLTFNGFGEMGKFFAIAMESVRGSKKEIKKGIVFFKSMFVMLIISGVLGTLFGFMAILAELTRYTENIGMGLSVAFITVYYSMLLAGFIAFPFKAALEKKLAEIDE